MALVNFLNIHLRENEREKIEMSKKNTRARPLGCVCVSRACGACGARLRYRCDKHVIGVSNEAFRAAILKQINDFDSLLPFLSLFFPNLRVNNDDKRGERERETKAFNIYIFPLLI